MKKRAKKKGTGNTQAYSPLLLSNIPIQDGEILYASSPRKQNFDAFRWLGISKTGQHIVSLFDYINQGKKGITRNSVDELAGYLGVSRKVIAEDIFDISVKTLERKVPDGRLNRKISSHAIEIARVMEHALQVPSN